MTPLFAHASANAIKRAFNVPVPLIQWSQLAMNSNLVYVATRPTALIF